MSVPDMLFGHPDRTGVQCEASEPSFSRHDGG